MVRWLFWCPVSKICLAARSFISIMQKFLLPSNKSQNTRKKLHFKVKERRTRLQISHNMKGGNSRLRIWAFLLLIREKSKHWQGGNYTVIESRLPWWIALLHSSCKFSHLMLRRLLQAMMPDSRSQKTRIYFLTHLPVAGKLRNVPSKHISHPPLKCIMPHLMETERFSVRCSSCWTLLCRHNTAVTGCRLWDMWEFCYIFVLFPNVLTSQHFCGL